VIVQMLFSLIRDAEYEDLIQSGECSVEDLSDMLVRIILHGVGTKPCDN